MRIRVETEDGVVAYMDRVAKIKIVDWDLFPPKGTESPTPPHVDPFLDRLFKKA